MRGREKRCCMRASPGARSQQRVPCGRAQVGDLVGELSRAGRLPETAEEAGLPEALHRKLWRYVWLRNQVRGGAPQG